MTPIKERGRETAQVVVRKIKLKSKETLRVHWLKIKLIILSFHLVKLFSTYCQINSTFIVKYQKSHVMNEKIAYPEDV